MFNVHEGDSMTVVSEDIGKQVRVVRDLERECEDESSVWIGHEGTLLRVEDTVFYIVKFSAEQMPKNMNIENNEAWFNDVELVVVSSNEPITEAQIEAEESKQQQLEEDMQTEVYPLIGGGHAIVRPGEGFGGDLSGRIIVYGEYDTSPEPLGLTLSRLNPHGVFTPDGRQIGSTCGCENYPCCGH